MYYYTRTTCVVLHTYNMATLQDRPREATPGSSALHYTLYNFVRRSWCTC